MAAVDAVEIADRERDAPIRFGRQAPKDAHDLALVKAMNFSGFSIALQRGYARYPHSRQPRSSGK